MPPEISGTLRKIQTPPSDLTAMTSPGLINANALVAATTGEWAQAAGLGLGGHSVLRVELPAKINGTARYAIDVQVPGMLYGTVLRSPVEGAAPDTIGSRSCA